MFSQKERTPGLRGAVRGCGGLQGAGTVSQTAAGPGPPAGGVNKDEGPHRSPWQEHNPVPPAGCPIQEVTCRPPLPGSPRAGQDPQGRHRVSVRTLPSPSLKAEEDDFSIQTRRTWVRVPPRRSAACDLRGQAHRPALTYLCGIRWSQARCRVHARPQTRPHAQTAPRHPEKEGRRQVRETNLATWP